MAVTVSLNQETPQKSTSHLGKTFFWARKNWSQRCQEPNLQPPPPTPQENSHSLFPLTKLISSLYLWVRAAASVLTGSSWAVSSSTRRTYYLNCCWFLKQGIVLVFKLCDKCDIKKRVNFQKATHWQHPRFASFHFFPALREHLSQKPWLQLGRKTLSRFLL